MRRGLHRPRGVRVIARWPEIGKCNTLHRLEKVMLHRFEGVLAGIIDLHGGARPAGRAWDVPATTVVSWLHGRHPSMVTLARVLAHLSPVQRTALFDALVSDAADVERPAGGQ